MAASSASRAESALLDRTVEALTQGKVVGRRVRCPACRTLVFKSWPEGWDSHAAKRCRGLKGRDEGARKAEFKRRYEPLFR